MEQEALTIWFDPEGDILEVGFSKARKGFFKDAGDDVLVRVDDRGKISGFAVLNATKRRRKIIETKLPVKASFSRVGKSMPAH